MYTLKNQFMRYAINKNGQVVSTYNCQTCHQYVFVPGNLWKMVLSDGNRTEIPVWSTGQVFSAVLCQAEDKHTLAILYDSVQSDDCHYNIQLKLRFTLQENCLSVVTEITNHDQYQVMEFQLTAASGLRSISGNPREDAIAWPLDMGRRIVNPACSDLSVYAGYRKYERCDQFHTDLNGLYPGLLSMQWYDWFNEHEGLYVGSHDASHQTTGLHVERDVKQNVLRLGIIRYPMLMAGESWQSAPVVYAVHAGDWHAGSRIYRDWMEREGGWQPPRQPDWMQLFQGWLRVILKQQHGEIQWDYNQLVDLYDEAEAVGMSTLFLLAWEKNGFARLYPDYEVDEEMGGVDMLKHSIETIHEKGGKVVFFVSYSLIDPASEYYTAGPGHQATIKSVWGSEVPFAETYCGEGTWRKLGNPPMPMYFACPGSLQWQEKLIELTHYCFDLGIDGLLFDLGGKTPYFCFDSGHTHKKPSQACAEKALRFKELRDVIRSYGPDKTIMMEHNVDIFAQHMDLSHSASTLPDELKMPELYRYTFPELIVTNRECGMDEVNYRNHANYSFLYGLRFDMSVYRCCGLLSDIPQYASYIRELNKLKEQYADYLLKGKFIDHDGFQMDHHHLLAKAYQATNQKIAVVIWNPTDHPQEYQLTCQAGHKHDGLLPAHTVTVIQL